jgi:probable HAF family extracellular repeat protein
MLVKADNSASATIENYSGQSQIGHFLVGYWSTAPGAYTELFSDLGSPSADGTWEDKDLTSNGVSDTNVAEILFANDDTDEENEMGVRANGSSVARLFNLRQENGDDGTFGRMHVLTDSAAVVEFRHQDVSDTHTFRVLGHWDVGVILSNHVAGQETDAFHEIGAETNAELFSFKLAPCAGSLTVTQLIFRLTGISGLVNGDWAGIEMIVDANSDGAIGVGETTSVGGAGVVNQAAGTITFSTSFAVSATTYYILRADFASLSLDDQVTIGLATADFSASESVSGSTTSVTHKERIECYLEKFETWTASSAATWQTQSLSGSPYSVPASAVVEIAVRNINTTTERSGGVRAVGSALERRFTLREAEDGGGDVVVMHVQTNASSQIQHYSEATADVDFVLLGYWICGTYIEAFNTFTAGANATWSDENLCSLSVGPGHIAEIVMTNDDPANQREAGVRTNGSSLQRRLDLTEAQDGGVDTATMFVEADASATATIELYAQDDEDVDFYLVGYWSDAPLAYTELFTDVGSPGSSATWEDVDLTASGISDAAVAEFVLANEDVNDERGLGIRENGSSLSRVLNLNEAEAGGADFSRMHIASDVTATIEWYHSDLTGSGNSYYLVGEWDSCSSSTSYIVTDLGAITGTKSSLGWNINSNGDVAGFEEDSSGNPVAWLLDCGTFSALGTVGGSYAEAHGINNSNRVVGWSHNAGGKRRAFTYSGGTMTDLGVISSRTDSESQAVNASSEVVGTVFNFASPPHSRLAFLYLPVGAYSLSAGMNSLGTLGGTQSEGFDINDSGQVVGGAQNASGNFRPFRWQNGTMTNLGTLGGETVIPDHRAEAINASGDVCGRSYTAGAAKRAFFWDGSMTDLGVLTGGTESWAFGLNESQVVVGTSNVTGGAYHAFVWDAVNGMRDLNDLDPGGSGWTLTRATDINDDGSIVGWGTNGSGNVRAFLLTPTCKAGGGAAAAASAALLASGSGMTDVSGVYDQVVVDSSGEPLAAIELVTGEQGSRVQYELTEPVSGPVTPDQPDTTPLPGFDEGKSLGRTLKVITTAVAEESVLTVSLRFTLEEIAELESTPSELELHVFDPLTVGSPGVWLPAGKNIGESFPTTTIGESGRKTHSDGTVEYWCVRDSGGQFAVGKPIAAHDVQPPRPTPRGCGPAMVPSFLFCAIALTLLKRRR